MGVGINEPFLVASNLLTMVIDDKSLLNKVNFTQQLYSKIREDLKEGKIIDVDKIKQFEGELPSFVQNIKNNIKPEDLDTIYQKIIDLNLLIVYQNQPNLVDRSEIQQLEQQLSNNQFQVSSNDLSLSHAGTFAVLTILPFIENLAEDQQSLILPYLRHKEAVIAAMKLANAKIASQNNTSEDSLPLSNIIKFGQPNFLAMATTQSVENTDYVSLFSDLIVTATALNKHKDSTLQLNNDEISSLLALVEDAAKEHKGIDEGKKIFIQIIQEKAAQKYIDVLLDDIKEQTSTHPLEVAKKVLDAAKDLTAKIDTKNLVTNLESTCRIINDLVANNEFNHDADPVEENVVISTEDYDSKVSLAGEEGVVLDESAASS